MKKIFGLFLALTLSLVAHATGIGGWNLYLAYHNSVFNLPVGDEIYANYDGNLLAYHPTDEEVQLFSKINGMNGRNVTFMGYSETEKCLILVYDDFQIDLFYPQNGNIVSLPQIKKAGIDGLVANQLFVDDDNAVLAVNNGLIHINLQQHEITGYYTLDMNIRAGAIYNGLLYAGAENTLYTCSVKGNPLDKKEWQATKTASFTNFTPCGDKLYGIIDKKNNDGLNPGLWLLLEDNYQMITDQVFPLVFSQKNKLVVADNKTIQIYDAAKAIVPEKVISFNNEWKSLSRSADGMLWGSNGDKGLQAYKISGNTLKPEGSPIGNFGPRRDLCYYMRTIDNRLFITGGRLDPYDRQHYPGTIMALEEGKWTFFQEEGIADQTGVPYRDITSIAQDPKDPTHHFASAAGTGLYEFRNGKFVKQYNVHNSPLESATDNNSPKYVRIDGLNYDAEGNLWMVNNSMRDTVLRVRRPNGTWKGFYFEPIKQAPTCEKTLIDRKGRLWMASRRTTDNPRHDGGLLCLDYNGTIDNTKDDIATYRVNFTNQDGKSYKLDGVYAIAEDRDGSIWVGTQVGLFLVDNPDAWHTSNFTVTQVKVPRNDGTNFADYLLDGLGISAIAIDGAGRKWVGTETNGLYLVRQDGTKILEHFTAENSPLLSNYIYSIAPNPITGEIMIGTDKGLCSYQSQATEPKTALKESNIKVYPNPVRPEYHGNVQVTGLTDNAEVKVMTTNGEVVASGNSTGGTFIWDVRGHDGGRVGAGVYYFMIATSDGKKGIAAKVVVI